MAGASIVAIECQPSRIEMRMRTGYVDKQARSLDEALAMLQEAKTAGRPVSIGLLGNAAELLPEMVKRGIRPDAVTDQTSRSEEHTSELQSLMRKSYAVFCLKKKKDQPNDHQ